MHVESDALRTSSSERAGGDAWEPNLINILSFLYGSGRAL